MSKRTITFSVEFALTNAETKQIKALGICFGYFLLRLKKSHREIVESYEANFDESLSLRSAQLARMMMNDNLKALKLIFASVKMPRANRESICRKFQHYKGLQKKWFFGQRSLLLGLVCAAIQAKRVYDELLPHVKELRS